MLLLQAASLYYSVLSASSIWLFIMSNKVIFIVIILAIFLLISIRFRISRKKKRKKREVIPPVRELLGSVPERLEELNKDLFPFGFAYEPYQDIFYSLMNGWQREFGYCQLYDEASAPLSMIIDCEPIRFEYKNKRWMIEFWKGQYGMTTGGEVGIYYTDGPDLRIPGVFNGTFYYCVKDEDRINMSFAFRKNGNLLFTRSGYHWWLTGFKLGEFSKTKELTMDIILELYDRPMAHAFALALKKAGYSDKEYAVQGNRVYVHFSKPHMKQPLTRTKLTEFIMQRNNRSFCESYEYLTSAYMNTLDKLEIVKNEAPKMYQKIIHVGKTKQVFDAFNKIKGYLKKP